MSTPAQEAPNGAGGAGADRPRSSSAAYQTLSARAGPSSLSRYGATSKISGAGRHGLGIRQRSQQFGRPQPISEHEEALLSSLDQAGDVVEWINTSLASQDHVIAAGETSASALNGYASPNTATDDSQSKSRQKRLLALDTRLAALSTSLTMAQQDTLAQMDANMADLATNVPRLGLELRLMADAAKTLKGRIHELQSTVSQSGLVNGDASGADGHNASQDAVEILAHLAELSTLHARMVAARDVLSLAESWSTLSSDVSAFLLDARYDAAATRLAQARSSLSVFERTPEYDKRKALLEDLGNSLEGKLAPSIEEALRTKDLKGLQAYADTLAKIGRKDAFAGIWRRDRTERCTTRWTHAKTMEEQARSSAADGGMVDAVPVAALLRTTLDDLATLIRSEQSFAQEIFKEPPVEVELLVLSIIESFRPSLRDRLTQVVPFYEHEAIIHLDTVHRVLRSFDISALMVLSALTTQADGQKSLAPESSPRRIRENTSEVESPSREFPFPAPSSAAPAENSLQAARRKTSRRTSSLSMGRTPSSSGALLMPESTQQLANSPSPLEAHKITTISQDRWSATLALTPEPQKWQRALFSPLLELQRSYRQLERANMIVALDQSASFAMLKEAKADVTSGRLSGHLPKALREASVQALTLSVAAAQRTRSFTYGFGYDGLVRCADEVFELLYAQCKDTFDAIASAVAAMATQRAKDRLENGEVKTDDLYAGHGRADGQDDEWKAVEDAMGFLAALRESATRIERAEHAIANELHDFTAIFLGTHESASDAFARLCKQGSNDVSSASFRLLLDVSEGHLREADKNETLNRIHALHRTSGQGAPSGIVLLRRAREALLEQVKSLQRHISSLALASILPLLEFYPQLTIWEANRLPGAVNEYDLAMPSFSLSPTEQMSRIGESLLDLPRLLEVWADSRDAQWGTQGLSYVGAQVRQTIIPPEGANLSHADTSRRETSTSETAVVTSPVREKRMSLQRLPTEQSPSSPHLDRRMSNSHRHTSSISLIAAIPSGSGMNGDALLSGDGPSPLRNEDSALQSYLSSICLTLVAHIVSLILPSIGRLSTPGASQLAADLDYLVTILSALNVAEQTSTTNDEEDVGASSDKNEGVVLMRTLEAWRDACKLKDADGRRLRHLVRTGQAARGISLAPPGKAPATAEASASTPSQPIVDGFSGSEDKLRSLLGTEAFDMVSRMRGW